MKYYILIILLVGHSGLSAQEYIIYADSTSGCNPLRVYFAIQPDSLLDDINSISWDFGNEDTSTSISPSTIYFNPGTYPVSCIINETLTVTMTGVVTVVECSDSLEIPNVFTPNDDQHNNIFSVRTNGVNLYSFSVFSRSGILVYKSESPAIRWDGRSLSGQKMKTGIYYYTIHRLNGEPLNEVKGFVYLFE